MKKVLLYLLFPILPARYAAAQHEGNVWAFGYHAGVDFNSGAPVGIKTEINQLEGTASVCDAYGKLLFYTDGSRIYDRNNNVMPNGGANLSTWSTTQAAAIVQDPGNADRYYVFSLQQVTFTHNGILYYRLVDMTLNGGTGDVAGSGVPNIIDQQLTEKMTVISGVHCNSMWLVVRSKISNEYKAYEITPAGINAASPVISPVGLFNFSAGYNPYDIGVIKAAPNGRKIIAAVGRDANSQVSSSLLKLDNAAGLELYDFDRATGILSNPVRIDTGHIYYGACFSPDNAKVYAIDDSAKIRLFQFDISVPVTSATMASKTLISTLSSLSDLKPGPDRKIYMGTNATSYLHAINFPDLSGTACQFKAYAVQLSAGTQSTGGLPNEIGVPILDDTVISHTAVQVCYRDSIALAAQITNGKDYLWNNGARSPSCTADSPGVYIVQYKSECKLYIDTFTVTFSPRLPAVVTYTPVCSGSNDNLAEVIPDTAAQAVYRYQWYNSDGIPVKDRTTPYSDTLGNVPPGDYTIHISIDGTCDTTLHFSVEQPDYRVSFDADTVICVDEILHLHNTTPDSNDTWAWQFGDGDTDSSYSTSHVYKAAGTYSVQLAAASVNGYCRDSISREISVKSFTISLSADKTIVDIGTEILLTTDAAEQYNVVSWMPAQLFDDQGSYTQNITVRQASSYTVAGRSLYGCMDTASIEINVNPVVTFPDAFTPNADGRNDVFQPVVIGALAKVYVFQIYDRWGKLVCDATGNMFWDGTYNGVPAAVGVYYYLFKAQNPDGRSISRYGEVTLLR